MHEIRAVHIVYLLKEGERVTVGGKQMLLHRPECVHLILHWHSFTNNDIFLSVYSLYTVSDFIRTFS